MTGLDAPEETPFGTDKDPNPPAPEEEEEAEAAEEEAAGRRQPAAGDEHFNPAVARPARRSTIVRRGLGFSRTWFHYDRHSTDKCSQLVPEGRFHGTSAPVAETDVVRLRSGNIGMADQANEVDRLHRLPARLHGLDQDVVQQIHVMFLQRRICRRRSCRG